MRRPDPSPSQLAATDPARSSWVGANAGSGKTHVLTQRVARLLLAGAEPHKILCLTFTKAAAAEMQTRLFRVLGDWTMAPADRLGDELGRLSGSEAPERDPARLADARRLFAKALETPGGLKIQTIHAFCESLLRRFPLEAGISPRYQVADDRTSAILLAAAREAMAEAAETTGDDAFDSAARLLNEGGIDALAGLVLRRRQSFYGDDIDTRIAAHFAHDAERTAVEVAADALGELDRDQITSLGDALRSHGGKTEKSLAEAFADWLSAQAPDAPAVCDRLTDLLLKNDGTARTRGLATKALVQARPDARNEFALLCDWAVRTRDRIRAVEVIRRARDLHGFAKALMSHHDADKSAQALLDFDDLVERARALLTDSIMRAWVLYKLDQGIDHILVDEAQDTAPRQWDVIAAIADEFLAGEGAQSDGRSIFVVGDEKQSIYSFQGAEPRAFGRLRDHFSERLSALGTPLDRPALLTSYRSAPAILGFVDAVFAGEAGAGLTVGGDPVQHVAHRAGAWGRVDLWPMIEPEEKTQPPPWWQPVDALPASDTRERLAVAVADHVAVLLREARLPAREGRKERPVRPADILVLVAKRDRLASGIIRRLKSKGVPVAGADRLKLSTEIAVQDLQALAKVVTMPSDDLSLAALLRSPLCGLSEEALFELAHGRQGSLWREVQAAPDHAEVAAFLSDMAGRADFLRPYEFLERVLIRHDGRRRLLARLGPEAEDAVDELLAQALAYEQREAPSLTGFVAWIEAGEIEVKREMEGGADVVRVMTVHGAKGLESPIVILPDTVAGGRFGGGAPLLLPAVAGGNRPELMLWAAGKGQDDTVTAAAREATDARERAERRRLLYVALTRAEDWLILCGAGLKNNPRNTWHEMLEDGMTRCPGVTRHDSPAGDGEMLRFETGPPPAMSDAPASDAIATPTPRPDWLGAAPREERPARLGPSTLAPGGGEHGGAGVGRNLALRYGSAVHLLLERLGSEPAAMRASLADRLLGQQFPDLTADQRADMCAEAERVLAMPEATAIFGKGTLAEVAVAIDGPGGGRMIGRIDRLLVEPSRVLIVDFKTDRVPPKTPETVSEVYLAQLGAYRSAIAVAYPDRMVETALLWTADPNVMQINQGVTDAAFRASLIR